MAGFLALRVAISEFVVCFNHKHKLPRVVLISAALVLMMTGPGLALFYGGLVRKKNTMMQSFAMMG